MTYLAKHIPSARLALPLLALLLAACSSDPTYKRQADGSDAYLKAPPLAGLHAPAGISLPPSNEAYAIASDHPQGASGKQVDIRPPAQALALLPGSQAAFTADSASLVLDADNQQPLWGQILAVIQQLKYPIEGQDDARQMLSTGWIPWSRDDEKHPHRARYQISLSNQSYQQTLSVKLLELQQDDKAVNDPASIQRYNALMLNAISVALETEQNRRQQAASQSGASQLDVQSGADDVGLPVLIIRGDFNTVWSRLPQALQNVNMKIKDTSRPQGSLTVSYKPLSEQDWQTLGARDPGLPSGDYKLQVGDLENRSSLQFIDPKGHTLTQSQNDALVAVFQAALNK